MIVQISHGSLMFDRLNNQVYATL